MYGVYISQLLRFACACDRYSDFLAHHNRLVQTLLDQGFRYGLLCRKFKQFYRSHHSLVQRYSHSVTQHLREDVDSKVQWLRIRILLVGAAVTGTDRLSIYPFTGVFLAFSSFLFMYIDFLKTYIYDFIDFLIFILLIFNLFIDSFFFFLSFFLKFSFIFFLFFFFLFFYFLFLLISFLLSLLLDSFSSEYVFL